jgi:hypothetical protein
MTLDQLIAAALQAKAELGGNAVVLRRTTSCLVPLPESLQRVA